MKSIILAGLLLLVFTGSYMLIKHLTKDDSLEYEEYLKNYEINEYIATYVTDDRDHEGIYKALIHFGLVD